MGRVAGLELARGLGLHYPADMNSLNELQTQASLSISTQNVADEEGEARALRARRRASWTGGLRRIDTLPEVELLHLEPSVLLGLVTTLSLEAWAMTGKPLPSYRREEMPGRIIRGDDASNPGG